LASDPDDVFLNFGLAMELAKTARYEESLARFARVIELDADYIVAYFQKAKTILRMGDREGTKQALAEGISRAAACGDQHAKAEMEQMLSTL
jgi:tetratricopeptide (TPR) repeat protein